jgi:uncharacterized membrane protein YqaE (UPF0057 family)
MNKLFIQIILFAVALATLSSCNRQSSISLTKRHYRSGYYVDLGTKKHSVSSAFIAPPKGSTNGVPTVGFSRTENFQNPGIPLESPKKIVVAKKNTGIGKMTTDKSKIVNLNSSEQNNFISNSPGNKAMPESVTATTGEVRVYVVNVPFVVIVLCAIFLPPLGVGLMYGINIYFWIDLVLTLLFFIPGMIFALIVVLM